MTDNSQTSDGVVTRLSPVSVAETMHRVRRVIEDRGLTLFAVVDHSGEAERVGLQMPATKLVLFGSPAAGTPVMLAVPLAALDLPLKLLVREDANGASAVSYNAPAFVADRHHLDSALRAPLAAIESIVEAVVGAGRA